MVQHNAVTIFSNGQAHIRTYHTVRQQQEFSLPFRKDAMEDVLATFGVYGNIRYVRPASFVTPTKNSTISLGDNTFEMIDSLRGACSRLA